MPADVRPFLVPRTGLKLHPWQLWDGDAWSPTPEYLSTWDPGTDLFLHRQVDTSLHELRTGAGLAADAPLQLAVTWTSTSSGMTELAASQPVTEAGINMIELQLPSARLGGTVVLRTRLCLARSMSPGIATAFQVGSVLTEDELKIRLEGSAARFPTTVVDFTHTRLHPEASWYLQVASDLTAPFHGTYLLMVNARDEELVKAVGHGSKADARAAQLLDELEAGVAEALLEQALRRREEIEEGEWLPDSVGDALAKVLTATSTLAADFCDADETTRVRAELQGRVRARGSGRQFV